MAMEDIVGIIFEDIEEVKPILSDSKEMIWKEMI